MHKPTLIRVLKILNQYAPEDPATTKKLIEHVVTNVVANDSSLDAKKLLSGAKIDL